MTDELAGRVLDAYKTSPLLTGLLILNIGLIGGFGWFLLKKNETHEALVMRVIDEEREFRDELLQVALMCGVEDTQPSSGKPGYMKLKR